MLGDRHLVMKRLYLFAERRNRLKLGAAPVKTSRDAGNRIES